MDNDPSPILVEEDQFKKSMQNYYNDLLRAQKAQESELLEVKDRLERAMVEKSKMVHEMKAKDETLDSLVKQLATVQDENKVLKDKSAQHTKETERLIVNMGNTKDQLFRERAENERLAKENAVMKSTFAKAEKYMAAVKNKFTEVENTNLTLRNSYERLHREYADLRTQWLRDNEENKNPNNAGADQKLVEELELARTEIASLQEMNEVKCTELEAYQNLEDWFKREESELRKLVEMTGDIRNIMSRRTTEQETNAAAVNPTGAELDAARKDDERDAELETLNQRCYEAGKELEDEMSKFGGDFEQSAPVMPELAPVSRSDASNVGHSPKIPQRKESLPKFETPKYFNFSSSTSVEPPKKPAQPSVRFGEPLNYVDDITTFEPPKKPAKQSVQFVEPPTPAQPLDMEAVQPPPSPVPSQASVEFVGQVNRPFVADQVHEQEEPMATEYFQDALTNLQGEERPAYRQATEEQSPVNVGIVTGNGPTPTGQRDGSHSLTQAQYVPSFPPFPLWFFNSN